LLAKVGLAQPAAVNFLRLADKRHFAFSIFDALSLHTVKAAYTLPIHAISHDALPSSRTWPNAKLRLRFGQLIQSRLQIVKLFNERSYALAQFPALRRCHRLGYHIDPRQGDALF
jgi:hypothetical protein